jgi:ABC-type phosphate/phosphonate transport system permease subunit
MGPVLDAEMPEQVIWPAHVDCGGLAWTRAFSWEQVPATRRDRIRQAAALTMQAITLAAAAIGLLLSAILALLIAAVGTRHSHRLPAPGPERTRRGLGTDGRPDPAGQS